MVNTKLLKEMRTPPVVLHNESKAKGILIQIPIELKRAMKLTSVHQERTMNEVYIEAVINYLKDYAPVEIFE